MAPVLKTGVPERVPGVRIPPSPPLLLFFSHRIRYLSASCASVYRCTGKVQLRAALKSRPYFSDS